MTVKTIYSFAEGKAEWKELLGGKGANLAEMTRVGLPVPPGFTITTEACRRFFAEGERLPEQVARELREALDALQEQTGKVLGNPDAPLLLSVRSGAVHSMPGMMDTILNLGLNDDTVEGLAKQTGNPRFAYDCYRRLIQMFGNVVLGLDHFHFEQIMERHKQAAGLRLDTELSAKHLQAIIEEYQGFILEKSKRPFPQNPLEQLRQAVEAVFLSWNNARARVYRKIHRIPDDLGTAVNVQAMVFGNRGNDSGTGVAFTRNPATGEQKLYGEFLLNAQGEDVVAGIRTPRPIGELAESMPEVYEELMMFAKRLELHYKDMQDIEFTIEQGKLYILQTRNGKRTAQAAVKIAVDLVNENVITREEALTRIEPEMIERLLHRQFAELGERKPWVKGLPASPGAATGRIVFSADDAERWAKAGEAVILVRPETTPDDIHGILAAKGILTSRGGMTSHAAVVARGMGKACICGCEELRIDGKRKQVSAAGQTLHEGDRISIDGGTGMVYLGELPLIEPMLSAECEELLAWADEVRRLQVRTNADTPEDAKKARAFGAEGIGLCRTEHMFMDAGRLPVMQKMIMAETLAERKEALEELLPMQKEDFVGLFRAMEGLPVTIRLLDPPLHEFVPDLEELVVSQAKRESMGDMDPQQRKQQEQWIKKVRALSEANPMLGHRGCRLALTYPEIAEMQVEAIGLAAAECLSQGIRVQVEIMVPLVGHVNELKRLRQIIEGVLARYEAPNGSSIAFRVGTMIEVPRAALTADEIAAEADFFSFGTNDLTQMTFGYSRDDAEGKFLHAYVEEKILPENPFMVLDRDGVGKLIRWAAEQGRKTNPQLKLGICGEHGGEQKSIQFCHEVGLDYVSCSPYRVPLARLAAAQAEIARRSQ
ncbi:pyruvate phosphate dikinase [Laceyella tengchongensis]|uniref:Pyruvate, phosphate dikinase n=1 Tax=Laceyella tengchongensis TaxID=574699 RepID=A0AA45WLW8_9BACL|nr:pyruvate, phosphate dikinase [Laceyella tengchongensis]SMP12273.1 pyruvate phosphate dikinase [Laceyella tengchongensis]